MGGGGRADGRQARAAQGAHVVAQAGELLQQRLDAAGRGEHQPVGGGQAVEQVGRRRQGLGAQHRHLGGLGAGRLEQAHDLAGAAAHARHQDAPPGERLRIVPGELLAQPHHLADDDQRRRMQAGGAHARVDVGQRAGHDALAGGRAALDHRGRRVGRARPRRSGARRCRARLVSPIRKTSVSAPWAMPAQSRRDCGLVGSSWPVMTAKLEA